MKAFVHKRASSAESAGAGPAPPPGVDSSGDLALPSFDEVYERHAGYVAGLAGRILGRNDEVPDLVQDVFLIAYRHLGALRSPESARAWLGRITVREASRRVRWLRLRRMLGLGHIQDEDLIVDQSADPQLRPAVALLYAVLDRIPARPRVAWVLRHLLDEPLDSVASLCGCSLATTKRRIAEAEAIVRPLLLEDLSEDSR